MRRVWHTSAHPPLHDATSCTSGMRVAIVACSGGGQVFFMGSNNSCSVMASSLRRTPSPLAAGYSAMGRPPCAAPWPRAGPWKEQHSVRKKGSRWEMEGRERWVRRGNSSGSVDESSASPLDAWNTNTKGKIMFGFQIIITAVPPTYTTYNYLRSLVRHYLYHLYSYSFPLFTMFAYADHYDYTQVFALCFFSS